MIYNKKSTVLFQNIIMSHKSRERRSMKEKYFNLLKDTANYVDPYVINTFNILFSTSSELKDILIKQYRF